MASINFHQKLMNNYNKPLVYHPDEVRVSRFLFVTMGRSRNFFEGEGDFLVCPPQPPFCLFMVTQFVNSFASMNIYFEIDRKKIFN